VYCQYILCDSLFQTVNTTNKTIDLFDLEPFTVYYMSIKCIPLVFINAAFEPRGFWSDIQTVTAKTLSDGEIYVHIRILMLIILIFMDLLVMVTCLYRCYVPYLWNLMKR